MELVRYTAPFDCADMLQILADIFGEYEAILETPQLDGTEQDQNLDIVYLAKEDNMILGTIHATIPKAFPTLCGISAMCTTAQARGKGIGRILFAKIVEELEQLNVKTMFLGTGNMIAAKLYHSLGFSYLPCSNVMVRFSEGDLVDFNRVMYQPEPASCRIEPGNASMRIPIIPLILHKGPFMMLDCNTNLMDCSRIPQFSCMSLYPRYLNLASEGGAFWGAYSESGVLGAIASVKPTDLGMRADFFGCNSFSDALPALMMQCEARAKEHSAELYLQIADADCAKQKWAATCGYHRTQDIIMNMNDLLLPCGIYRK